MRNTLLILFFGPLTLSALAGLYLFVFQIKRSLKTIMGNQAQFDAQVATLNTKIDAVGEKVTSEAQQIRDFIAANPTVNTEALEGVAARLDNLGSSVAGIFEPTPTETEPGPANPDETSTDPTVPTEENPNPQGEAFDPDPTPAPLPPTPEEPTV